MRIEIAREELPRALTPEMAAEFTRIFKALGFTFVTLDMEGSRSGSMNALLPVTEMGRLALAYSAVGCALASAPTPHFGTFPMR